MATEILPGYTYDRNTQRYRSGETGKFVSRSNVLRLVDKTVAATEQRMNGLIDELESDIHSPSAYADKARVEARRLHLQQAALAKGGWDRLDQSDYGRVGAATRQVYAKISGTADDYENGDASLAQVRQRNRAYTGSARKLFHQMERDESTPSEPGKVEVEQRILDPAAEHCEDCLGYAAQGVQMAGTLPVPGDDCQCGDNCRCELPRWEVDVEDLGGTLGKQRESNHMSDIQIEHDVIQLRERAIRNDGTMPIKLISPGWGASGYYSPEVLRRDGPQIFASGTHMYWDHPTMMEENDRPENSLRNLAAVLIEDARWDEQGLDGPGLYAEAKAFGDYKPLLDELAPHIGVSIRASGRAKDGEADGRKGKIIEKITARKSADFVTVAGAGGKIIELFEAARDGGTGDIQDAEGSSNTEDNQMSEKLEEQLKEALADIKQLQEDNAQLQGDNQSLQESQARTNEALLLRAARDYVADKVGGSALPDVTKARLSESLSANPPVADGALDKAAYTTAIEEAIKAESTYITTLLGESGRITGMGSTSQQGPAGDDDYDEEEVEKRLSESFGRLGLDEKSVSFAVNGRA